MFVPSIPNVKEISGIVFEKIDFSQLINDQTPIILRGVFKKKPLVLEGKKSPQAAMEHLSQYYSGLDIVSFNTLHENNGRFFYNHEMTGFNFQSRKISLSSFFKQILDAITSENPEMYYAGSTDLPTYFPKMIEEDGLSLHGDVFKTYKPTTSIWMGNRTTAAIHYDMSNNVAACMVGRRRFTLFPPDQIYNLYPGPLSPTPAGQTVSMVDLAYPDFDRYPNFKLALAKAQVAELEPGDMLVYPAMWWHQVDALEDFNILINYWWNEAEPFMDTPMNSILYAILALRDRPIAEKNAWKNLFNYYVFEDASRPRAHLPEHVHGTLGRIDHQAARRLRQLLLQKLNR